MKTALITTTIRVPEVLKTYRSFDPDAVFFVAGDKKTPHAQLEKFVREIGNAFYYSDTDQEKLGYACSGIIGWNRIMRRNIALLEAVKWGAEIIVTVDDDNIPLSPDYFDVFRKILSEPYSGPAASSETGWFNAGAWLEPAVYHRGFPYEWRHQDLKVQTERCSGAKVGVAAGLWLGDPDIDAVERLALRPDVTGVRDEMKTGMVLRGCVGPFNTQNTAFRAELAPLLMVYTGVGRYDDIFASMTAQRFMADMGLSLYFGNPMVRQERNPQDLFRNLEDELFGMRHMLRFKNDLFAADLGGGTVIEKLRRLAGYFREWSYLPPAMHELTLAWCSDLEKIYASQGRLV